ncbi:SDR family NAD(P)-dependent oxidoreductase [Dysgonomonas sp. HGC4]|uniref:SDR family NAD(P)-dependent oxidoreductase n=1 Tax=Dysgonomonas sp. HGC4 TaxID=1658009 RepID=UPI00067FB70D|nr:SDR family NAD(P)-dependent oxidoreductase [Dysgonomonas sp. HGC4]MBD8347167.1 SDR family NAD(P)-dependent oxidoreductase [Dysgonomonas sp. HGC4]
MKKIALITGATSGIGKATAERLAKDGFDIIITGRRKEKLQELESLLQKEYKAEVLSLEFDVRNYAEVEKHLGNLSERWKNVDVLVNNAGLAVGLNSIQEGVVDDWERMIDTNIKGLLYVTRIISPVMVSRKSGHIINIGSIASREVYVNGGVYCATKHAVKALSEGMRLDMVNYGIKVTLVCPGAAETEFSLVRFKGDGSRADKVYDGFVPLTADDVADAISYAVSAPDHVDVQDILLMAKAQASATVFHKE